MKLAIKILGINVLLWIGLELLAGSVLSSKEKVPDSQDADDDKYWVTQTRLSFDGGLYEWDPHCFWRLRPEFEGRQSSDRKFWGDNVLRINRNGMRSADVPKSKPPGVRRVLVVGGSHPMGMYVNSSESYAAVLNTQLNDTHGKWQVLNAAVPGYTTYQAVQYLLNYASEFSPDIVIFDAGVNDKLPLTSEFPTPDHAVVQPPRWASGAQSILQKSSVYRLIQSWAGTAKKPISGIRVPDGAHVENLTEAGRWSAEKKIKLLYMSQVRVDVHGSGRVQCQYEERAFEPRVDVCKLFEAYEGGARRYFADPIHANKDGHAMIAGEILKAFRQNGWL